MDGDEFDIPDESAPTRRRKRRWLWRLFLSLLASLALAIAVGWLARERIADNFIAGELEKLGLPATYEIERISGTTQVLRNIVIGDPAQPDLTVERAEVRIIHRLGSPQIGRITLTRPRLYGTFQEGTLSFGSLDPLLFKESDDAPGLPEIDLALIDGRALLDTDYGRVGIKAEGSGRLDDGFTGIIAATAPRLNAEGCQVERATAFGSIETSGGKLQFSGPARFRSLSCAGSGLRLADANLRVDALLDEDFGGVEAETRIAAGAARLAGSGMNGLNGTVEATWRGGRVDARYALVARGVDTPQAAIPVLRADGSLRSLRDFARIEVNVALEGNGVRPGPGLDRSLASFVRSAEGTFLQPLAERIGRRLAAEGRGSALTADLIVRRADGATSLVIPRATLRGGSGATLLALSSGQYAKAPDGAPRFSGNFSTGGEGLPRIAGRMERPAGGATRLRIRMAEYGAGGSSLSIPDMDVMQDRFGNFVFEGRAVASGSLPGGSVRNLALPLDGRYARTGELALWQGCTDVRFDSLTYANFSLDRHALTLCPGSGGAILRSGAGGLRIAAGAPSLDVSGRLGETPIAIRSGPVGFAYPGVLSARKLDIALGPQGTATRFAISNLDARLDGGEIAGTFADTDVFLDAVPLDVLGASGRWRYADGALTLTEGEFQLEDRADPSRFYPLSAQGATLSLVDNIIAARADLREPGNDRLVTTVDILHNLESGRGHADLAVPGILFDDALQPDRLSRLALGVVANVEGEIVGTGRIDWSSAGVTSTGRFASDDLDFAAAFGPVQGASGTVVFTDLLGLTTAPDQRLRVASVNPGIEVPDGEVRFALQNGELLAVEGASWPFMGGTLTLRRVDLNLGISEERRYIFDIVGLNAAVFVDNLDIGNIAATGTFDGTLPIIFDATGTGRIEGGNLLSRPPGGNVSYVGELTYEDLSPMANFAFDALRSLNYTEMRVLMDGNLTGELVTRVRFDGVTQGEGTSSNFITKQIAKLPIRFNVNIRAPFYQLITSIKAMYDPAFVRDPRELGLVDDDGTRLLREVTGEPTTVDPSEQIPEETAIQTPDSETMR